MRTFNYKWASVSAILLAVCSTMSAYCGEKDVFTLIVNAEKAVDATPIGSRVDLMAFLGRNAKRLPKNLPQTIQPIESATFERAESPAGYVGNVSITLKPGQKMDLTQFLNQLDIPYVGSTPVSRQLILEPKNMSAPAQVVFHHVSMINQGGIPKLFFGSYELKNLDMKFHSSQAFERNLIHSLQWTGIGAMTSAWNKIFQAEVSPLGFSTHWAGYAVRHFLFI